MLNLPLPETWGMTAMTELQVGRIFSKLLKALHWETPMVHYNSIHCRVPATYGRCMSISRIFTVILSFSAKPAWPEIPGAAVLNVTSSTAPRTASCSSCSWSSWKRDRSIKRVCNEHTCHCQAETHAGKQTEADGSGATPPLLCGALSSVIPFGDGRTLSVS